MFDGHVRWSLWMSVSDGVSHDRVLVEFTARSHSCRLRIRVVYGFVFVM